MEIDAGRKTQASLGINFLHYFLDTSVIRLKSSVTRKVGRGFSKQGSLTLLIGIPVMAS